jgi:hypothetical protein
VDGTLDATKSNPHSGAALGSGTTRYGFLGDGSEASSFDGSRNGFYYEGVIDEVRIWNVARTASEINSNMNTCLVGNETGLEVYYRMSEGSGSTLTDYAGSNNATIYGAVWIDTAQAFSCSSCGESDRKAIIATIHPEITAINTTLSYPASPGTKLYLSATGGSGNFDYQDTNGVFAYSGSYQPGTITKTIPNGGTFVIEAKDENGCTLIKSGINSESMPTQIVTTSTTKTGLIVPQDNNWYYITDGNGNAIAALRSPNSDLGTVSASVYVDAHPSSYDGFAYLGRHFVINPQNAPNADVDVRLYLTDAELTELGDSAFATPDPNDDISSIAQLGVTKYDGPTEDGTYDPTDATSVIFIPQTGNGSEASAKYIEFSTNSFSEFWPHASQLNSALPIELLSFTAEVVGDKVHLNWITASETNNDYFTVQRSVDGISFEDITYVDGAGNSNEIRYYSAVDEKPLSGLSYYRLKQTDFDGGYSYSKAVAVKFTQNRIEEEISIYPNPNNGSFNMRLSGFSEGSRLEIHMRNITGKEVLNRQIMTGMDESVELRFNEQDVLQPGIYLILIVSESNIYTKKIIVK